MKKHSVILAVLVFAVVLLVSGCGKSSTLTCTQTTSGVDITFYVGFQGNTIDRMDFDYDMDLSSYSDTMISALEKQDFCSSVKNSMSQYKDAFTNCNQNIENKHLKVSSKLDVDKIAKSVLNKMTSPKNAQKQLETEGYKCTIK